MTQCDFNFLRTNSFDIDYASELIMKGNQAEILRNLSVSLTARPLICLTEGKYIHSNRYMKLKTRCTECMLQSGTIK